MARGRLSKFTGAQSGQTGAISSRKLPPCAPAPCRVTYVSQSAAAVFKPRKKIMDQVTRPRSIRTVHQGRTEETRGFDFCSASFGLPDLEKPIGKPASSPGCRSGQLQRCMDALRVSARPRSVVFDEIRPQRWIDDEIDVLPPFKEAIARTRAAAPLYHPGPRGLWRRSSESPSGSATGAMVEYALLHQIINAPKESIRSAVSVGSDPSRRENTDRTPCPARGKRDRRYPYGFECSRRSMWTSTRARPTGGGRGIRQSGNVDIGPRQYRPAPQATDRITFERTRTCPALAQPPSKTCARCR